MGEKGSRISSWITEQVGIKKTYEEKTKNTTGGFPRHLVVKNPPANAGDTSLIPGLGRSHMPRSS